MAGLQVALTLGRACRRVLLIDDGRPRNATSARVMNYLGVPGLSPGQLLAAGARALASYDVRTVAGTVTTASGSSDTGFELRVADRRHRSRTVVLAGGVEDVLPPVPGLRALWGQRVVACPHCHGWEVRGRPLVQLGFADDPAQGAAWAVLLSRWSNLVTFFPGAVEAGAAGGAGLPAAIGDRLARAGVRVWTGSVDGVAADGDGVRVSSGDRHERFDLVFTAVRQLARSDLADRLGCRPAGSTAPGAVQNDDAGRTTVDGVWAAGSAADSTFLAIAAAGHAAMVATRVHAWLTTADLAVEQTVGLPVTATGGPR